MKLFLFLFLPIFSFAQSKQTEILPMSNGVVVYSDTVSVPGIAKNELYNRAKKWASTQYNSPKDAIQIDDKEAGQIMIKGVLELNYFTRSPIVYYSLSISVKEGRYKYSLTDFRYSDNQNKTFSIEYFPKGWVGQKKLFLSLNDKANALVQSLLKAMNESSISW